jgi:predicted acylesterase/phospholipase RssA
MSVMALAYPATIRHSGMAGRDVLSLSFAASSSEHDSSMLQRHCLASCVIDKGYAPRSHQERYDFADGSCAGS